jgi:hypothetical protein
MELIQTLTSLTSRALAVVLLYPSIVHGLALSLPHGDLGTSKAGTC